MANINKFGKVFLIFLFTLSSAIAQKEIKNDSTDTKDGMKPFDKVIKSNAFDAFTPHIEDLKKTISERTKAIIINSPNNPAGIHYSDNWMKEFAEFIKDYPNIAIISDELYSELSYFDPKPTYFYQQF